MAERSTDTYNLKRIQQILDESKQRDQEMITRQKVRRQLVVRSVDNVSDNLVGTYLPPPFDKSVLGLKTIIGEVAKATQHYASRIAANTPDIAITPPSNKSDITQKLDKTAGDQEKLDSQLWEDMAGREKQWDSGMNMATGGVSYYVVQPRDIGFGLPDRLYYEDDADISRLRGKLAPMKVPNPKREGRFMYAEDGDVWAERRKQHAQSQPGCNLFTLEAYPRDMIRRGKDQDGLKWLAVVEEISGIDCMPGSELAQKAARYAKVPEDDVGLYGIWEDSKGNVFGGIEKGIPEHSSYRSPRAFTMVTFFDRMEKCVLIGRGTGTEGLIEVWRGKHGCKKQGAPAVPAVEVAMMRMGIYAGGQEFTTPMEPVFAYAPLINQMLTILSNAAAFNGIPRWIVELPDGSILRGEDGEPKVFDQGDFVPGLNPAEAIGVNGKLVQVEINIDSLVKELEILWQRLDGVMPAPASTGVSGASAAAWQVRQLIQQAQESLRQPVDNHASGVKEVLFMCHEWMRSLDVPIHFFATSKRQSGTRGTQALIEFDPKNLTDAIHVTQELDTPEEQTVRIQMGIELLSAGVITKREFLEEYLRAPDAREAEIDMYVQMVTDQVMTGAAAQPGSVIQLIADGVRGHVHYELIALSDNYAATVAEGMADAAQLAAGQMTAGFPGNEMPMDMQAGQETGTPPEGANVANATGVRQPSVGMSPNLQGTLGQAVPGGMAPAPVAGG